MIDHSEVKKVVLLLTIGLCDAIRNKTVSIREAEHYLFSPRTMRLFEYDKDVKDIIHLCTEFDDIARLVPDPEALDRAIVDVKKRAETAIKKAPPCDYQQEPWLVKLMS